MRRILCALILLSLATGVAFAGATADLRIETREDEEGDTVYKLVNISDRPIRAKIEHRKQCASVSRKKPQSREYWVGPRKSVQLRKVWAHSSCEHRYRILQAHYTD